MLEKSKEVAEIIAIATLRTQQEIEDMLKRADKTYILVPPTMDTTALTNILSTIVFQSYYADFMNAIRLVRTLRVMISPTTTAERIATTEGRSIWGQIDNLINRYHWTLEYILWGDFMG